MDFSIKDFLSVGKQIIFDGKYPKPTLCPWCGYGTDGPITNGIKMGYGKNVCFVISIRCTHCENSFIAVFENKSIKTGMVFITCLPQPFGKDLREELKLLSPRFCDMHKQAEYAELNSMLDLAGIGYRTALEILIKDYAIQELKCPPEDVAKKKLADAIGEYLNQSSFVKTADVVRILGNDVTHYDKKHPECDFVTMKNYYSIFIDLVATQYAISHPPVERRT